MAETDHENDLIRLGEDLKESARIVLQDLYKVTKGLANREQLVRGILEAKDQQELVAALNNFSANNPTKAAELQGLHSELIQHWIALRDGNALDKMQYFTLVDTIKVIAQNAIAPRLQQSDPICPRTPRLCSFAITLKRILMSFS